MAADFKIHLAHERKNQIDEARKRRRAALWQHRKEQREL